MQPKCLAIAKLLQHERWSWPPSRSVYPHSLYPGGLGVIRVSLQVTTTASTAARVRVFVHSVLCQCAYLCALLAHASLSYRRFGKPCSVVESQAICSESVRVDQTAPTMRLTQRFGHLLELSRCDCTALSTSRIGAVHIEFELIVRGCSVAHIFVQPYLPSWHSACNPFLRIKSLVTHTHIVRSVGGVDGTGPCGRQQVSLSTVPLLSAP